MEVYRDPNGPIHSQAYTRVPVMVVSDTKPESIICSFFILVSRITETTATYVPYPKVSRSTILPHLFIKP